MNRIPSNSPHIHCGQTTAHLMRATLLALLPALAAGVYFFGLRALVLSAVSALTAVATEQIWSLLTKQHGCGVGAAALTGLLLAMTLPVSVPYWLAAIGSIFAIAVAKMLCGGLGQNCFNPALAARAFLVLLWPVWMVRYPRAGEHLPVWACGCDAVSAATPLHDLQVPVLPSIPLEQLFWGDVGGSLGEVCAPAILLGGAYLLLRRVITWRIPAAYLGTAALLTLVFSKGENPILWMLYSLLSGSLLFAAFFMAGDYVTSPASPLAQLAYGAGCGALTIFFRYWGLFPEGVTYAILLMNACAWLLDRALPPKRFGLEGGRS